MVAAHRRLDDARAIVIGAADHRETQMAAMRAEGGRGIGRGTPGTAGVAGDRVANHRAKLLISHQ